MNNKKIALINLNSIPGMGIGQVYPIGLTTIKSYLEQNNIEADIIDFFSKPEEFKTLDFLGKPYDYIGVSLRNLDSLELNGKFLIPIYSEFLTRIKENADAPIIIGGPGFSIYHEGLKDKLPFDFGVVGDGEQALLKLLQAGVLGTDIGDPAIIKPNNEPFTNQRIYFDEALVRAYVEKQANQIGIPTLRGKCKMRCSYCAYSGVEYGDLSKRDISILKDDILALYQMGVRDIFFTDSVFNFCSKHAKEICRMLIELDLPELYWSAYFIPTTDQELLQLIAKSNCKGLMTSFDTFSPEMLSSLNKGFTLDSIIRYIDLCQEYELPLYAIIMFGCPGESERTAKESCSFANMQFTKDELFFSFGVRIQPGSYLARRAGLSVEKLVYPYFWPFEEKCFDWVLEGLDSELVDFKVLGRILNWRMSHSQMRQKPVQSKDLEYVLISQDIKDE